VFPEEPSSIRHRPTAASSREESHEQNKRNRDLQRRILRS
jgi:hypothetical protein